MDQGSKISHRSDAIALVDGMRLLDSSAALVIFQAVRTLLQLAGLGRIGFVRP
jgi:hypothetical protein